MLASVRRNFCGVNYCQKPAQAKCPLIGWDARPHLYPLPQERIFSGHVLWYPIALFVNPVAGISKNAGSVSPSPVGEGRGEDGRPTNFIFN
jgi:hypothetical protein